MKQSGRDGTEIRSDARGQTPADLADAVYSELTNRSLPSPKLELLTDLFESMYVASLKTEESKPISFHIVCLDPNNSDPRPPQMPPSDRWSCIRLGQSVPLRDKSFLKIAAASDPRTSSFAVYNTENGLVAWGLIDQGNQYHDYVHFDSETGPERPGLFQASITGVGHIEAYTGYEKIAELRINSLVRSAVEVFDRGPVREALTAGINSYVSGVHDALVDDVDPPGWEPRAAEFWLSALRRLLLRVQNIRHGGAFLITSDPQESDLAVKHVMRYGRLASALRRFMMADIRYFVATDMNQDFLEGKKKRMPIDLHINEVVSGYDVDEIRNELRGTIWFISLLTRVDGLVLMNQNLEVLGFGTRITAPDEPENVFATSDAEASESNLRQLDYQLYGTRHQSMMRYCAKHAGSVGLVISQDGDVRVMTKAGTRLIVWENIRLQLPRFVSRKPRRKKGGYYPSNLLAQ